MRLNKDEVEYIKTSTIANIKILKGIIKAYEEKAKNDPQAAKELRLLLAEEREHKRLLFTERTEEENVDFMRPVMLLSMFKSKIEEKDVPLLFAEFSVEDLEVISNAIEKVLKEKRGGKEDE